VLQGRGVGVLAHALKGEAGRVWAKKRRQTHKMQAHTHLEDVVPAEAVVDEHADGALDGVVENLLPQNPVLLRGVGEGRGCVARTTGEYSEWRRAKLWRWLQRTTQVSASSMSAYSKSSYVPTSLA